MISPVDTIAAISRNVPEELYTWPLEPSPTLAVATELAEIVEADPTLLTDPARFLADDRHTIHAIATTASTIVAQAIADILACAQRYLADAVRLTAMAAAPGSALPAIIRLAQRSQEALAEVQSRLAELERELGPHEEKLVQLVNEAQTRPAAAPGPTALYATDELKTYAAPTPAPAETQMEPAVAESSALIPVPETPPESSSAAGEAAVAAAKSQLGTPYVWGGTQPGGFDCSGLTSWAYRQAGVEIPRLADQQATGTQVSFDQLQPGDLAVWDGHVAMYAGDGNYIEAGNPVQMSPVRTDNIGMTFMGFWRPTA